MHTAFTWSSFKFTTMNASTKLPLTRLYSTKRQNVKSSSKNYYDILNITPHASQNEVKTAYYKLSLQYHPDKNKSEYAKKKFQDISNAYEVLGNYETRKNYDRQMLIHHQPTSNVRESTESQFKDNIYSSASKIYNFDEWTRVHYGKEFRIQRERRDMYQRMKAYEDEFVYEKSNSEILKIALFLLILSIFVLFNQKNVDKPIKTKRDREENDVREN